MSRVWTEPMRVEVGRPASRLPWSSDQSGDGRAGDCSIWGVRGYSFIEVHSRPLVSAGDWFQDTLQYQNPRMLESVI